MSLDPEKLQRELIAILDPFKDLLEGTEADAKLFLERVSLSVTFALASGNKEMADEIVGGLRALAWSSKVNLTRANALVFQRVVLAILRTALAVLATV